MAASRKRLFCNSSSVVMDFAARLAFNDGSWDADGNPLEAAFSEARESCSFESDVELVPSV